MCFVCICGATLFCISYESVSYYKLPLVMISVDSFVFTSVFSSYCKEFLFVIPAFISIFGYKKAILGSILYAITPCISKRSLFPIPLSHFICYSFERPSFNHELVPGKAETLVKRTSEGDMDGFRKVGEWGRELFLIL